jgi:hypothetical protein
LSKGCRQTEEKQSAERKQPRWPIASRRRLFCERTEGRSGVDSRRFRSPPASDCGAVGRRRRHWPPSQRQPSSGGPSRPKQRRGPSRSDSGGSRASCTKRRPAARQIPWRALRLCEKPTGSRMTETPGAAISLPRSFAANRSRSCQASQTLCRQDPLAGEPVNPYPCRCYPCLFRSEA